MPFHNSAQQRPIVYDVGAHYNQLCVNRCIGNTKIRCRSAFVAEAYASPIHLEYSCRDYENVVVVFVLVFLLELPIIVSIFRKPVSLTVAHGSLLNYDNEIVKQLKKEIANDT